jgi:glutathione S-transferase
MLDLHLFQKAWDLFDINPYAMKADAFMRLAKLQYMFHYDLNADKAPRGELPYLTDNNEIIGDSSHIIDYLICKYNLNVDNNLTPYQKAVSVIVQRMLEEHMYPIMLYSRMVDPAGLMVFKRDIFSKQTPYTEEEIDDLSKNIMFKLINRGIGRYQTDEIYQLGLDNLKALDTVMQNDSYVFNETPNSIDATIYAFLQNILQVPIENPINKFVSKNVKFIQYCKAFHEQYY